MGYTLYYRHIPSIVTYVMNSDIDENTLHNRHIPSIVTYVMNSDMDGIYIIQYTYF